MQHRLQSTLMWPKALLELLPHLTRLVPMLNRYFQSRGANDDATRQALERKLDEVAATLRADMTKAAVADPDLVHKLRDQAAALATQSEALEAVTAELKTLKTSIATQNEQLARMEKLQGKQQFLLLVAVLFLVVLAITIPLMLRHR